MGEGNNALLAVLVPLVYAFGMYQISGSRAARLASAQRRRGAAAGIQNLITPPSNTGVNKQLRGRTGVNTASNRLTPMVITGITLDSTMGS